jgi:hypothetical protein
MFTESYIPIYIYLQGQLITFNLRKFLYVTPLPHKKTVVWNQNFPLWINRFISETFLRPWSMKQQWYWMRWIQSRGICVCCCSYSCCLLISWNPECVSTSHYSYPKWQTNQAEHKVFAEYDRQKLEIVSLTAHRNPVVEVSPEYQLCLEEISQMFAFVHSVIALGNILNDQFLLRLFQHTRLYKL